MAVALGVTDIEDTDPSKFWYRWRNLISSCSKTYFFYEGLIVPVSTLPSELFSVGISASVSRTEISIEPLFLFTLLAVRWHNPLAPRPKMCRSWQTALEHEYVAFIIRSLTRVNRSVGDKHGPLLFLNNQPDALIIWIYSVIKLYMFRAPTLPIIRSVLLYIRQW